MATETQTVSVVVEAVGTITWEHTLEGSDVRYSEPEPIARVIDADRNRYVVTGRQCFRNGTTINDSIVGLKGVIEVCRHSAISFNCPTMFGKRGI